MAHDCLRNRFKLIIQVFHENPGCYSAGIFFEPDQDRLPSD